MKLEVRERLILLSVLPQTGNFVTLKTLRDLQGVLSFTEEEHKLYNFVQDTENGTVVWDDTAEQVKEVEIGERATDLIVEALKKLDESKQLKLEHYSLYEKFCEK